jgi:ISXO2-like transposase domain
VNHFAKPIPACWAVKVQPSKWTKLSVGGLEKNKHRSQRKHKGTGGVGKEAVDALVERKGRVRSHHVPKVTAKNLAPILEAQLHGATVIYTDEGATSKVLDAYMRSTIQSITALANMFAATYVRTPLKAISRS